MWCKQEVAMSKYLTKFLEAQKKAIELYKWVQSEKAGHDLGREAVLDWCKYEARAFRKNYVKKDLEIAKEKLSNIDKVKDPELLKECLERIDEVLELMEE